MALTKIQSKVLEVIAANRDDASYFAGGAVMNAKGPRQSDDLDIFHDTDELVHERAKKDIAALQAAGIAVALDLEVFGTVEATASWYGEKTIIQWMSETARRFFPIVDDPVFGKRMHDADLAVNKTLATAMRRKARDLVDLADIVKGYAPLGALASAVSGKLESESPLKIIERIRRTAAGVSGTELMSVRSLVPVDPSAIREQILAACDDAETYCRTKLPPQHVGALLLDEGERPVAADQAMMDTGTIKARAPTEHGVWPVIQGVTDKPGFGL
ncbi:MAG: hypothetical protein FJX54_23775 [Alphaproteobacteria bacterium]|nr:hypothetical protein [Alphaproteobacteria bacterium]